MLKNTFLNLFINRFLLLKIITEPYKYKYQGQERQDELGLNWNSFKWRNYDYTIGRFMSIDPLATDFPQWSPYVFSGNLVTMTKELEGMEPSALIGPDGKLTQGAVTVLNAAFSYTPKSLTNTTWIKDNDPRTDMVQNSILKNNKSSVAVTSFSQVAYNRRYTNSPDDWWMGTIAHEQKHRQDINEMTGVGFYLFYIKDAASHLGDEKTMATEKPAYKNDKYGTQLWNYNNGEVASIFQTGNISENQRSSMLESAGNRFKRDVILVDQISDTTKLINSTTNIINGLNANTDKSLISQLKGLVNGWQQSVNNAKNEQNSITKKYGK